MGKRIAATFNGTGATVYLCLGFVPDWVRIWAAEDAELAHSFWSRRFRAAESDEGFIDHGGDQASVLYTAGTGIAPYEGGDLLTATLQSSTGYGEGVYLTFDPIRDYSKNDAYGYDSNVINKWTLGSSANRTGNFNEDTPATVSRIGEGSEITIREEFTGKVKRAVIESLTAGAGEAANEVTLSRAIASGDILRISGMFDLSPIAVGKVTPAGVVLYATTEVNVNDELNVIEAGTYDN
jgi:hypothetical protein